MRPSSGALLVLCLAALHGLPAPVLATTVRVATLGRMVAEADRIVVAEVVEVRCEWEGARGDRVPITLVTARTAKTLKGPASPQFVLEFLGGTVDGDTLEVLDVPSFAVGDRDVLFIREGRRVSPLVGMMRGRFRITASDVLPHDRVATYDGHALAEADFARPGSVARAGAPLSLAAFERTVLDLVAAPPAGDDASAGARGVEEGLAAPPAAWPEALASEPAGILVSLGASPALLDGCSSWRCVIDKALAEAGAMLPSDRRPALDASGLRPAQGVHVAELSWGGALFGRALDQDTLAVTLRLADAAGTRTTIAFNETLPWNAYAGPTRSGASGEVLIDLRRVAARELAAAFDVGATPLAAAATSNPGAARSARDPLARASGLRARAVTPNESPGALGSACDPGGVVVDPRLLSFDSADHYMMSAYQVGFFQRGASSPTQIVDVPLTAFLVRRVIDLPSWAVLAMQSSLVADIRSAGLSTPLGVVYTYRVRGVWSGGTTEWSEPSQLFVRCAATATATR